MTREEALVFAVEWTAAWNELAVERVLAHFDEHVLFTSPTARTVVGVSTVLGKQALREYWNKAVAHIDSLHFVLDRVLWDPGTREMAIVYLSEIDGRRKQVSEQLTFGPDGLVVSAEVFHGVDL
ncbi:MAG: nuclear transport factor 2 family protein [Nitrospira sp.]|nr:nuclear transport factor 2 family protein [Nitrospira sp.]